MPDLQGTSNLLHKEKSGPLIGGLWFGSSLSPASLRHLRWLKSTFKILGNPSVRGIALWPLRKLRYSVFWSALSWWACG